MTGADDTRDVLIAAVRTIEVGPFGPNAMAMLNRSGFTRLTPSEAEQIADVIQPILAAHVAAVRESIATAIEAVADDEDYIWVSGRQALNHAAGIARTTALGA